MPKEKKCKICGRSDGWLRKSKPCCDEYVHPECEQKQKESK